MPLVILAPEVAEDFERILEHLLQHEAPDALTRIVAITHAIDVLKANPLIGRPSHGELRELVIGVRTHGYVALYVYLPGIDTVLMLGIRSQREAGYIDR
jgi:toxin ParE1/3/4